MIAMFHYATHNLKAARNAYLASSPKESNFLSIGNTPFGWKHIIECYTKDQTKVNNGQFLGRTP